MKRKVLAIALSLALLTSLFVFAAPVVAEPAPQAEQFIVSFSMERTGYPSGQSGNRKWLGAPATLTLPAGAIDGPLETRTLPHGIMKWWPWTAWGVIEGDFGPVIGEQGGLYNYQSYATYNYHTGKIYSSQQTAYCEFYENFDPAYSIVNGEAPAEWGALIGTMKVKVHHKATMLYWRVPGAGDHRMRYSCNATIVMNGGTGVFDDLRFNGNSTFKDLEAMYHDYEGMGHMAPKST
jgi:hypothetical protein